LETIQHNKTTLSLFTTKEQQISFSGFSFKKLLTKPPSLYLPQKNNKFLFPDFHLKNF